MGATLFLGAHVKANDGKVPKLTFDLRKLQLVSVRFEKDWRECCQKCTPLEIDLRSWYQKKQV